jgi:hypothetical protein
MNSTFSVTQYFLMVPVVLMLPFLICALFDWQGWSRFVSGHRFGASNALVNMHIDWIYGIYFMLLGAVVTFWIWNPYWLRATYIGESILLLLFSVSICFIAIAKRRTPNLVYEGLVFTLIRAKRGEFEIHVRRKWCGNNKKRDMRCAIKGFVWLLKQTAITELIKDGATKIIVTSPIVNTQSRLTFLQKLLVAAFPGLLIQKEKRYLGLLARSWLRLIWMAGKFHPGMLIWLGKLFPLSTFIVTILGDQQLWGRPEMEGYSVTLP